MLHVLSIWLLVAAFFGAGVFNAIGTPATKAGFVRWGYPQWWCRLTGGLEIAAAVLVALPASRIVGLALRAVIITAAVLTVLRVRELSHLLERPQSRRRALDLLTTNQVAGREDAERQASTRSGRSFGVPMSVKCQARPKCSTA